jgi:flagellar basal-body rod protein FlgB
LPPHRQRLTPPPAFWPPLFYSLKRIQVVDRMPEWIRHMVVACKLREASQAKPQGSSMLNGLNEFFAPRMAALGLRAQRSETLASNVANADTPGYKARDFNFASALQSALGRTTLTSPSVTLRRTSPMHLAAANHHRAIAQLQYRIPAQSSIDGNTVDLDTELGQFSDNAVRYQADLTFLSNQIRTMQQAIASQ